MKFSIVQKIKKANRTDKLLKNLKRQTLNKENSEYSVKDDLLYKKNKLYVSNKNELRETFIQKIHKHFIIDYSEI